MARAEDYERYAEHCLKMAEMADSREDRVIRRDMAVEWLTLAAALRKTKAYPRICLLLTGPRSAAALDPVEKPGSLLARKHPADMLARHTSRALGIEFVALGERASASIPSSAARMRA